jgi:hypothetical protein
MATLIDNTAEVLAIAEAIDIAIGLKGGTIAGEGKLRNAVAGILSIPTEDPTKDPLEAIEESVFLGETSYVGEDLLVTFSDAVGAGAFVVPSNAVGQITCDVLLVGGGGGGGNRGGGGGAGGFVLVEGLFPAFGTYAVTVGKGGAGGSARYAPGSNGGATSIYFGANTLFNALGGGGGGSNGYDSSVQDRNKGRDGGSGGGSAKQGATVGLGASGQGHDGGASASQDGTPSSNICHGGGGGAGAAGASGTLRGKGGAGLACSITGSEVWYAGGGAGGGESGQGKTDGGKGGGGSCNSYDSIGGDGTDGLGGGGAGGGGNSNNAFRNGGKGGDGVAIIRFHKI